ncbi:hypothetical protein SeLEV6574_g06752 [Synchytrium endobioticum]|uniref:MYND-type domain-containing protein n=1 Tax=Synchytrium endobioticum TaxID=286115 RepID=A0A507CF67_9FUNG|nr:hypothetical protein SeLEV6574_g06752 [Synchytrium endobioticum]
MTLSATSANTNNTSTTRTQSPYHHQSTKSSKIHLHHTPLSKEKLAIKMFQEEEDLAQERRRAFWTGSTHPKVIDPTSTKPPPPSTTRAIVEPMTPVPTPPRTPSDNATTTITDLPILGTITMTTRTVPPRTFSLKKGASPITATSPQHDGQIGATSSPSKHYNGPLTPYQSRLEASALLASVVDLPAQGHTTLKTETPSRSLMQLGARMNSLGLSGPTLNPPNTSSYKTSRSTRDSYQHHGVFLTPDAFMKLSSLDPRIRIQGACDEMDALYTRNASASSHTETVMTAWARLIRQAAAGGMFEKRLEALERLRMFCVVCRSTQALKQCARCYSVYYCGQDHQKEDWKLHKSVCDRLKFAKIDEATLGWPVSLPPLPPFTKEDLLAIDNWVAFVDRFMPFGEKWQPPVNAPPPQKDFHLSLHRCLTDVTTYPFTIALTLRQIGIDVSTLKRPLRIHLLTFLSTDLPGTIPPKVLPRCLDSILLGHQGIEITRIGPDVDPCRDAVFIGDFSHNNNTNSNNTNDTTNSNNTNNYSKSPSDDPSTRGSNIINMTTISKKTRVKQTCYKGLYHEWRTRHYRSLEPIPDLAVLFHPMLSNASSMTAALPSLRILASDSTPILITDPDEGDYIQTILSFHEHGIRPSRVFYSGANPWCGLVDRQSTVFLNRVCPTNGFMMVFRGLKGAVS